MKMDFESSIEFSEVQLAQKHDSNTKPTVDAILVVREDETERPAVVVHYRGSRLVPREEDGGPTVVDEECAAIFAHVDAMMIPFHDCAFYPCTLLLKAKQEGCAIVDCLVTYVILFSHSYQFRHPYFFHEQLMQNSTLCARFRP
jgi:hypothetical protein